MNQKQRDLLCTIVKSKAKDLRAELNQLFPFLSVSQWERKNSIDKYSIRSRVTDGAVSTLPAVEQKRYKLLKNDKSN
jgi:hypothetical protein